MKTPQDADLPVVHLMRTYGNNGGEQQLSQYFGAKPQGAVRETFVFVYDDPVCSALFSDAAPNLEQLSLWRRFRRAGTAWQEFGVLLPMLPVLQFKFLALMLRRKPAVCVVHGFQAALVAWPAALLLRRCRWTYMHRTTKARGRLGLLFKALYAPFHAVAGNSRSVMKSLSPFTTPSRLVALENGLDWRRFETRVAAGPLAPLPPAEGPVVVSVGRLLPLKGQAMLIDAFNSVIEKVPGASLWIVGDGPEAEALKARVKGRGLEGRVHLLGRRNDVPAVLAAADIFANASSWEGMSNAVLEGMAAGLPSVVADAPGVSECHENGVTGLVVRQDAGDLAGGMLRLLADADLRERMGAAARERVRTVYSMEANRQRFLDLFDKLTGQVSCAVS